MTKRIDTLTDAQRATFPEWVDRWTEIGLRTGPLSTEEWTEVEAAARKLYAYAGKPEPRLVIGVQSPMRGAIAAAIAAEVSRAAAAHYGDGVGAGVGDGVGAGVGDGVRDGVGAGVWAGVGAGVWAGVGAGVWDGVRAGVGDGVGAGVGDGVGAGVRAGVGAGVRAGVGAGVWAGVGAGVWAGVGAGVWDGVRAGVGDGVGAGVWDGVGAGVRAGVWDEADLLAPFEAWLHDPILRGLNNAKDAWYKQFSYGNLNCSFNAWATWFRDVGNLELDSDQWERLEADNVMMAAGPAWWYTGFCVISDRPTVLHIENIDGVNRLHCEDGPAIAWADGWGINSWHGVRVPDDFFTWDLQRAMGEKNTEVRRCAIERLGWENFTAQMVLVAEAPDPGNDPHTIRLYDLGPSMAGLYDQPARILVVANASLDKGGARRVFGLPVEAHHRDPIAAAASLFDVPAAAYQSLARAT